MAQSGVALEGFEQIDRLLRELPETVRSNRVIGQALTAAMKPVLKRAKGKVPRDTGLLRLSLTTKLLRKRRNSQYRTVFMGPAAGATMYSSTGKKIPVALYGTVVEFGWSDNGISPSKKKAKRGWKRRGRGSASRPPRPYMRPALESERPHILGNMVKSIGKKIEREAAKLAKKR